MSKRAEPKPPPSHLSAADLSAMLLADRDMACAKLKLERDQLGAVANALRLELQVERDKGSVNATAVAAAQAEAAHRRLVADIGVRYAIDWERTSFVPETGELVHLP